MNETKLLTAKIGTLNQHIDKLNLQNKSCESLLKKLTGHLLEHELKNSTSDWRTIYGKDLDEGMLNLVNHQENVM